MKRFRPTDLGSDVDNLIHGIAISTDLYSHIHQSMNEITRQFNRFVGQLQSDVCNHKYRELPEHKKAALEAEIKLLLHAQRDCHRNRGKDATKIGYFGPRDEYYCDCIGILRCLQIFGYGEFTAINARPAEPPELSAWLNRLEKEVLEEEGFHTDNRCEWCLKKYGKDDKSEREKRQSDARISVPSNPIKIPRSSLCM